MNRAESVPSTAVATSLAFVDVDMPAAAESSAEADSVELADAAKDFVDASAAVADSYAATLIEVRPFVLSVALVFSLWLAAAVSERFATSFALTDSETPRLNH